MNTATPVARGNRASSTACFPVMLRRIAPLAAAASIVLVACGGDDPHADVPAATDTADATIASVADGTAGQSANESAVDQIESSPRDVTASGLDAFRSKEVPAGVPEPLVAFDEIRSGGPPPDGIPPVDDPVFLDVADVEFLADNEPVLALEIDGDARAYPVQILTWHEIVNDTVGGIPVSVTYCPLCNSAVAYDRRLDDLVLDFGTSGLLYNSALVMYDRQTETLWSHFTGQGVIGELTGRELESFPLSTVSWSTWRDANPDGLVLSRDTGFSRDYGRNPYPGYDDVDGIPFLFEGDVDGRYTALTRIVGIELDDEAVGVPLIELQDAHVIAGEIAGTPLVVLWAAGTSSALQNADIASGVDVGATGVFIPEVDGQALTFSANGDGTFTDDQTGSTWSILGEATAGELAGARLEALVHVDTFWFAWSTFLPDTEVLTG